MTRRERFLNTLNYQPVDRRTVYLAGPWPDTLARWKQEGLPAEVTDVHEYLGVADYGTPVKNISSNAGLHPVFERKKLREDDEFIYHFDHYGRTVKDFKHRTSFPEWLDFPVKEPADLRRILDERYNMDNLDERFPADWEAQVKAAEQRGDVIEIQGGCYYWTLRSLADVDGACYLLYDAPELVKEMFDRYFTVVMYSLRRAVKLVKIDRIGFGEDFAYKNGPLLSPAMFREMILPYYRQVMELAHAHDIRLTWHDSDGDYRLLLPDMLAVGVNSTCPCEVAASMDPVELRRQFGKELRIGGGFDKRIVAAGKDAIAAEFKRLQPVIEEGGFIPGIDHSIPADVSYDNYRYYLDTLIAMANKV